MFPKDWTSQQVVDAIQEAYKKKEYKDKGNYIGTLSNGMKIEMFIENNGKILSAFPKY